MYNQQSRIRLKIVVGKAPHFLELELPYFKKYFDVVDDCDDETVVLAYAPDVLEYAASLPGRLRTAVIFPGFGFRPYCEPLDRAFLTGLIDKYYELVFVNPGPMEESFRETEKLVVHPFCIDLARIPFKRPRQQLNSLLHASAIGSMKKDWMRSVRAMQQTGLKWEIFPPRPLVDEQNNVIESLKTNSIVYKFRNQLLRWRNRYWHAIYRRTLKLGLPPMMLPVGYLSHDMLIKRYQQYDGFVHIAKHNLPATDAKYTATLLEAGATGSLLFWHDTLGLGNDFETIFNLPLNPTQAAKEILHIRQNVNIEQHSRQTAEEIRDRCNPDSVMRIRLAAIENALNV
jgi:hypothetical protein